MSVDLQRLRFPVSGPDIRVGEPYSPADHQIASARRWCLHLRSWSRYLPPVQDLANQVMATGAEILTGDYCGGDSWAEWAEPYSDETAILLVEPGRALHVYFTAADEEAAKRAGFYLALLVGINDSKDAMISTAGDWSEQLDVV